MQNDQFWDNLERAFADDDNRRFDAAKEDAKRKRDDRRLRIFLSLGILASIFATFFVFGVVLFSRMPLPPEIEPAEHHYSAAERSDLTSLVKAFDR